MSWPRRFLTILSFPFLVISGILGLFLMIVGDRGDGDCEED